MSDKQNPLTPEELDATNGEPLPDREAMSIITPGDPIQILPLDPIDPPDASPVEQPEEA